MRLATLRDGTRDGVLIVVDREATRFVRTGCARSLQAALDGWEICEPELREIARGLDSQSGQGEPLDVAALSAPLPRAYEWIDGSAYLNHILLVRKARGAEPPEGLETDPLVYQGGSGVLLGPTQPLEWPGSDLGLDFEGELAVVLGDVPRGTRADDAGKHLRLMMLANDVTYRDIVPAELRKGFGFFVSKPATAFAPFAVTLDELGGAFQGGRAFLRLVCTLNGSPIGDTETGPEMHFSFLDVVAHVTKTRSLTAGTIIGSGTVSNRDARRGASCLVERRTRETLDGAALTPYMKPGDSVRIEAFGADGRSVFGAIEQKVVA
jgi:fumarylacetoacetate (FAA) hydrolase